MLRQDETTRDIPIVVVTADAFESGLKRAAKAGADAVLVKPCLPERLAEQIQQVLALSRGLRERAATARDASVRFLCPRCDQPLNYVKSHIGGVSERLQEQWDYFESAAGCGTFQYRQRTRKVRPV